MGTEGPVTRFAGAPLVRSISTHQRHALVTGWRVARTEAGAVTRPEALERAACTWLGATAPGTVASALRASGRLPSLERCEDLDASDWWYCVPLPALERGAGDRMLLRCGGLATLADVFLDGEPVATSANMFRELMVELPAGAEASRELVIRFRALRAEVERTRKRPRWRASLVEHQGLRWHRTTLLGRMPGWCPPVRPVGPWQPVWLERRTLLEVLEGDVLPMSSGTSDRLVADVLVRGLGGARVRGATLVSAFGRQPLEVRAVGEATWRLTGDATADGAERWWPHTHGGQPRYEVALLVDTSAGGVQVDLGEVAFRTLEVDRSGDGFTVVVNGAPIFCRGACWSPTDVVTLRADAGALRRRLALVREAGMNMLRVSGVMAYEDTRFHRWCDELGILVWQDFMFARLDYPVTDAGFLAEARAEASEVVALRRRCASTAVWCGNSEVAQTAAMLGLEPADWSNALFEEALPRVLADAGHDAPYLPSTPSGGPLPFTPSSGTSHYFGVGAMRRPLDDARRAGVRFACEALGFANVGEGPELPGDELWRARIPRDAGTSWDFEDVRDHYAAHLFGVDPAEVRRSDPDRYVAMARVTSAEVMRRTFAEWRRAGSACAGALVWLLADPWRAPGWGLLDDTGRPKAPWHWLRRVLAPRTVFMTDEGLNGLLAHVANDADAPLVGTLEVSLLRHGRLRLASAERRVSVPPRSVSAVPVDAVLGRFTDVGWSYRFGPPSHDVVLIDLRHQDGTLLASDLYLPQGLPRTAHDVPMTLRVVRADAREMDLELGCDRLAYAVRIEAGDWTVLDNYVHVAPGRAVTVRATGPAEARPATVVARAFNGRGDVRADVPPLRPD